MDFRLVDDLGPHGFSSLAIEPMTRTSHALAVDGQVWFIDPVDWQEAIDRARTLGTPSGVLQLLDRHNRDSAAIAARLGVPHVTVPTELPGTPFEVIEIKRSKRWQEIALWWSDRDTLVVAEALGTNAFFTEGSDRVGVHGLLKLTPPRQLDGYDVEHLLVGHGPGVHGADASTEVAQALRRSRLRFFSWALSIPLRVRRAGKEARL